MFREREEKNGLRSSMREDGLGLENGPISNFGENNTGKSQLLVAYIRTYVAGSQHAT